jgi:WD40 repeat protein
VKIWDVQGRQPQEAQTFRGHMDWVTSVAFSRDGAYLVSASVDKTIRLWELVNREALLGAGHSREVLVLAVSPDGKTIASGSGDRSVRLWDPTTGRELGTPLLGHGDKVTALAFAPEGKRLVSAGGTEDRTLRIWNTEAHKEIRTIRDPGPANDVPQLIVTPDGKQVIAWVVNNTIEVYDLATGGRVSSRSAAGETLTCLSFSADAQLAALGGAEGRARIVNLAKLEGLPGGEFPAQPEELADLAFTPDKKILIAADRKGRITIWDLAKRAAAKAGPAQPERTIEAHRLGIAALAVSATGRVFATTGLDNAVKVWETATGKEVRQWDFSRLAAAGQPLVRNLAFTPDGKGLVTANGNSTLFLLEVP